MMYTIHAGLLEVSQPDLVAIWAYGDRIKPTCMLILVAPL